MSNLRQGAYGYYYGSLYNQSTSLTNDEMLLNVNYITRCLLFNGWSRNAIAALCGNMQKESSMNPGRWQSNNIGNTAGGYGLVQWTPASKYFDWCSANGHSDPSSIDANLERILYELKNNDQWIATNSYNFSFQDFSKSTMSVSELAKAFLLNYERPADQSETEQNYRAGLAENWYTQIQNIAGGYTPRLSTSSPTQMEDSIYWYSTDNPFYPAWKLPNCTCYAWGRFWEIGDPKGTGENKPSLPTGNAEEWFANAGVYETNKTVPKLGAVACWHANDGSGGHVAIVEKIDPATGDITTSNSSYPSINHPAGIYFYTGGALASDGYNISGFTFQGFIYNPFAAQSGNDHPGGGDTPTITRKRKNYKFILFNRRRRVRR